MLAIARALMSKPKLLLLDEPSLGLAPMVVDMIFDIIRQLKAESTTILLVEQNANSRWTSPIAPMCWNPAASPCPAQPKRSSTIRKWNRPTWACEP